MQAWICMFGASRLGACLPGPVVYCPRLCCDPGLLRVRRAGISAGVGVKVVLATARSSGGRVGVLREPPQQHGLVVAPSSGMLPLTPMPSLSGGRNLVAVVVHGVQGFVPRLLV